MHLKIFYVILVSGIKICIFNIQLNLFSNLHFWAGGQVLSINNILLYIWNNRSGWIEKDTQSEIL